MKKVIMAAVLVMVMFAGCRKCPTSTMMDRKYSSINEDSSNTHVVYAYTIVGDEFYGYSDGSIDGDDSLDNAYELFVWHKDHPYEFEYTE